MLIATASADPDSGMAAVVGVLLAALFGAIARSIWRQTIILPPFSDLVPLRTLVDATIRGSAPLAAGDLAQAVAFGSGSPAAFIAVVAVFAPLGAAIWLFNWPRWLVAPTHRSHPGALRIWAARLRRDPIDWEPDWDPEKLQTYDARRQVALDRRAARRTRHRG